MRLGLIFNVILVNLRPHQCNWLSISWILHHKSPCPSVSGLLSSQRFSDMLRACYVESSWHTNITRRQCLSHIWVDYALFQLLILHLPVIDKSQFSCLILCSVHMHSSTFPSARQFLLGFETQSLCLNCCWISKSAHIGTFIVVIAGLWSWDLDVSFGMPTCHCWLRLDWVMILAWRRCYAGVFVESRVI